MGTITTAGRVIATWPAAATVEAPGGEASLEAVHRSLLDWFTQNLKAQYGYEINGNEIYWLHLDGIPTWPVVACEGPSLTFGVTQGNEGWQVRGFCRYKRTATGSVKYWPLLTAKVWSLGAACQLVAALTEATADMFNVTPALR
jgi:hypothetical protein